MRREGRWEEAAGRFRRGLALWPAHRNARIDFAYTLLKTGEAAEARDQFLESARRNPDDWRARLESAFLCHETQRVAEARRTFAEVREEAPEPYRTTASEAFDRVDGALAEGIARWQAAIAERPDSDTVHEELAQLAEARDDWTLAARHYAAAWALKPEKKGLVLALGRVRSAQGDREGARRAFVAAARGGDTRTAELAREALGRTPGAEEEAEVPALAARRQKGGLSAIDLADRSYRLAYLADAEKHYRSALESEPKSAEARLGLARTLNLLGRDADAYYFFGLAKRESPEARAAWRRLRPEHAFWRPTVWALPMYSTRWHGAFVYGQAKLELNPGWKWVRPYVSLRFVGDSGRGNAPAPLSERALTPAIGIMTRTVAGVTGWFEFGSQARKLDTRAGVFQTRNWGAALGTETPGAFFSTTNEANYAQRFANALLLRTENRAGWTLGRVQIGAVTILGASTLRDYWANFAEAGPSVRFRLPFRATLSADAVRGRHLSTQNLAGRASYYDLRIGIWYALTY
jgi:tetratricopeptide (TPR) repeat protein